MIFLNLAKDLPLKQCIFEELKALLPLLPNWYKVIQNLLAFLLVYAYSSHHFFLHLFCGVCLNFNCTIFTQLHMKVWCMSKYTWPVMHVDRCIYCFPSILSWLKHKLIPYYLVTWMFPTSMYCSKFLWTLLLEIQFLPT